MMSIDFDAEARKILQRSGSVPNQLEENASVRKNNMGYNDMDAIYTTKSGATIFVGNLSAAQNLHVLKAKHISHVVNCTHGPAKIPDYHHESLKYFEFRISDWQRYIEANNDESVLRFTDPLFQFINEALDAHSNVLVHCAAGAHRAGTTGCLCLMHYENLSVNKAINKARSIRPIISPIAHLPLLLVRYEAASKRAKRKSRSCSLS